VAGKRPFSLAASRPAGSMNKLSGLNELKTIMRLGLSPRRREACRDAWALIWNLPFWVVAFVWRSLLVRTTFIAVTGSFGKTTTKDCLEAILSSVAPTVATAGNANGRVGITRTILRVRPWHRFAIVETGTDRRGAMVRAAILVRPDIALILCVARSHSAAFRTLEDVAREKAQLLRFLPRNGTAVLSGDDSRIAALRERVRGKVVTFGGKGGCDVVGGELSANWPDRLRMTVTAEGETESAETQLVGIHWANAVLGAVAVAKVCGVGLRQACAALSNVSSCQARMHPEPLPNGAIVVRDDYNGSIDSLQPAFEFLRTARAERRILVLTDCTDFRKNPRQRQSHFARLANQVAEVAVFVGERCEYAASRAVREGMDRSCVYTCFTVEQAAELLRRQLRPGDLVLLRGRIQDHLARIYFRLLGEVDCRRTVCRKRCLCDACEELGFRPQPDRPRLQAAQGIGAMADRCWESVAANEHASWYLDPLVAEQKRAANLNLAQKWLEERAGLTILKTDLFEEANSRDELLSGLPDSARLIGMDIAPTMVLRARTCAKANGARFLATDVRQIGLASESVDAIFSNSTLDHFSSKEEFKEALRELIRILRPGGTFIVTLDNPRNPLYAFLRWLGRRGWLPFPLGYTAPLSALVAELEDAGIEVSATDYLIHNPRVLSTAMFLVIRRVLGRFADWPIGLLLRVFGWLDRLPTRGYTACFEAARGTKRG